MTRMSTCCRAFNPQEAKDNKLVVEQRRNRAAEFDYYMNGARYSNGYLHKSFAIKAVTKSQGPPDVDELQRFNQVPTSCLCPC